MTTVTEEMVEAAIEALDGQFMRLGMRAALEAAISVMPVPTDAEFREAVESLIDASMGLGNVMAFPDDPEFEDDDAEAQSALATARRTLLAMHARAKQQGLRELRKQLEGEAKRLQAAADDPGSSHRDRKRGQVQGVMHARARIDAMLGGSHE